MDIKLTQDQIDAVQDDAKAHGSTDWTQVLCTACLRKNVHVAASYMAPMVDIPRLEGIIYVPVCKDHMRGWFTLPYLDDWPAVFRLTRAAQQKAWKE